MEKEYKNKWGEIKENRKDFFFPASKTWSLEPNAAKK